MLCNPSFIILLQWKSRNIEYPEAFLSEGINEKCQGIHVGILGFFFFFLVIIEFKHIFFQNDRSWNSLNKWNVYIVYIYLIIELKVNNLACISWNNYSSVHMWFISDCHVVNISCIEKKKKINFVYCNTWLLSVSVHILHIMKSLYGLA